MSNFKPITAKELDFNAFKTISDWGLITAGNKDLYNTMTASWGGVGIMWNRDVVFAFIRPQRYTFEVLEKSDIFTFSFFDEKYKPELSICGTKSGRDIDKVKQTGLTPIFSENGVYFSEAKTVFCCKKIYEQFIVPEGFVDKSIEQNYGAGDYHKMFIGEITAVLKK